MTSGACACAIVRPIGSMNSSLRISRTLAGLRFVINVAHLTDNYGRPDRRLSLHPGRHPTGRRAAIACYDAQIEWKYFKIAAQLFEVITG